MTNQLDLEAEIQRLLTEDDRIAELGITVQQREHVVVLGGEVGLSGGTELADRVAAEMGRIIPARPRVVPTSVTGDPVLCGAIRAAVDQARQELLASVAST